MSINPKTATESFEGFARQLSHDIAGPVNAITMHLDLVEHLTRGDVKLDGPISRARKDLDEILNRLRAALYLPPSHLVDTMPPLARLIDDCWRSLDTGVCELDNAIDGAVTWEGSCFALAQALRILLANAIESGADQVRCDLDAERRQLMIRNAVVGENDPSAWREAFYTTKVDRRHLGLGLNMADHALQSAGRKLTLAIEDDHCLVTIR